MGEIFFFIQVLIWLFGLLLENESLLVEMIIVAFPLKEKKESYMKKKYNIAGYCFIKISL